jgi:hypothetical protein
MHATNAISHAIYAISDKCEKSDTYYTCDIALLIPRPHLFLGVRRIGDLNDAARAALAPLLGDDDVAVDRDCDVDDIARPMLVTTINTMDGNAAEPRGDVVVPSPSIPRRGQRGGGVFELRPGGVIQPPTTRSLSPPPPPPPPRPSLLSSSLSFLRPPLILIHRHRQTVSLLVACSPSSSDSRPPSAPSWAPPRVVPSASLPPPPPPPPRLPAAVSAHGRGGGGRFASTTTTRLGSTVEASPLPRPPPPPPH